MSSYTAENQTAASAECPQDVIRQLLALGVESNEISSLTVEQQKSYLNPYDPFPSGTVEQSDDVYEEYFFDDEFERGYEKNLWRQWMASPSPENRKGLALEGYRSLRGLKDDAELTDFVVQELMPFARNEDKQKGWDGYMQRLSQLIATV